MSSNPRYQQSSGCRNTPYFARQPRSVPHPLPSIKYTSVANISYSPALEAISEFTLLMLRLLLFCMKHLYDCQHLVNDRTDFGRLLYFFEVCRITLKKLVFISPFSFNWLQIRILKRPFKHNFGNEIRKIKLWIFIIFEISLKHATVSRKVPESLYRKLSMQKIKETDFCTWQSSGHPTNGNVAVWVTCTVKLYLRPMSIMNRRYLAIHFIVEIFWILYKSRV